MKSVRLGSRQVGPGRPCYVIAEAGSNHDGKLDQAMQLIDLAAEAGADAVKFQIFRANRVYPRSAGVSNYLGDPTPIFDIIEKMEMPYEWLPALAGRCAERTIDFLASVFDEESADRVEPYVPAFKIASYEMTHVPLVRHTAKKGKPVMISTGTANLDEVAPTVDAVRSAGNEALVLMQCTAAYPAPLEDLNLRAMATLQRRFNVPVGFSDHSRDPVLAPVAAVACGAVAIEKHFTLSNSLPGPDHKFAVEPPELRLMVRRIREAETALGSGEKIAAPIEQELRAFARRTIFARRGIRPGEQFTAENLVVLRCGRHAAGLPPAQLDEVIGRRAARAIAADAVLHVEDLA